MQICHETCQATLNVRCHTETYQVPGSSLVSVKACQGTKTAVCQIVKVLSPAIFGEVKDLINLKTMACIVIIYYRRFIYGKLSNIEEGTEGGGATDPHRWRGDEAWMQRRI